MNKNLFSGIQPSGLITIGNYIGIISKWINYQYDYTCFFCINDLHSITNKNIFYKSKEYKKKIIFDTLSLIIASGIDPELSNIFLQSNIYEHTYLFWILLCNLNLNKLMKNKNINNNKINNINVGKLNYPILMASDILLYKTDVVLTGNDQIYNIELCKFIINRFNNDFKNIFKKPKFIINTDIIKSLTNPDKKMSKSDLNNNSYISILDNYNIIKKKIRLSITDSDFPYKIIYDELNKKGISNLINIMSKINNISINEIEKKMINKDYKYFKNTLSNDIYYKIENIQYNYNKIRNNENYLKDILYNSYKKIKTIIKKNINEIKNKIGIYE